MALRHDAVVRVRGARAAEARVADLERQLLDVTSRAQMAERQLRSAPGNPHDADHRRLARLIERRRVTPFAVASVLKIRVTDVEALAAGRTTLARDTWRRLWAELAS